MSGRRPRGTKLQQQPFDQIASIDLAIFEDESGTIIVAEAQTTIPFVIRRTFFIRDVKPDAERGRHAHRRTEQVIAPVSGSFELDLTDSVRSVHFKLDEPKRGVYVPPMIWGRLYNFTPGAICLVFASTPYGRSDYVERWSDFLKAV